MLLFSLQHHLQVSFLARNQLIFTREIFYCDFLEEEVPSVCDLVMEMRLARNLNNHKFKMALNAKQ